MAYRPLVDIPLSLLDNSSTMLTGGVLKAYVTGTSDEATLYADENGTSAGTSVTLDARGEPTTIKRIWLDTGVTYKLVLEDGDGNVLWTVDPVYGSMTNVDTFLQAGTGAVSRSVQSKLRDFVSVADFGAVGDGATDDTAAIQSALTASKFVLIPPGTYAISSGLTIAHDDAIIFGYGAAIKWLANRTFGSRFETIQATSKSRVTILGLTIDGNKENQANIPSTPAAGISYGSAFRLNSCSRFVFRDVYIKELHGYGIMLYSTNNCTIDSVTIKNCGNKRAVSYSTADTTINGELYKNNNVADGIYLDSSNDNKFTNVEIGHDDDGIQDAASMRAGVVIVSGDNNVFEVFKIYNVCRAIHLEPDINANTIKYNKFSNVSIPNIGGMMTAVVLYETTSGQIEQNEFDHIKCAVGNSLTQGSNAVSVFSVMYTQNYQPGFKASFKSCTFPEYVTLNNGETFWLQCSLKGFQEVSPGAAFYTVVIDQCYVSDKIYLDQGGKQITLRNSEVRGIGHRIGGASAIDEPQQCIILENNYFQNSDASNHFFERIYAPAIIRNNRFSYVGVSNSPYSWIGVYGRTSADDAIFRVDSNTFEASTNTIASALYVPSFADVSYTTDGQNTVYDAFSTGWGIDLAKLTGAAASKN